MDGTETKCAKVGALMKSDRLLGIKYWALYEPLAKRITLFKYIGYEPDTGMHCFQTVRGPNAVLYRNHNQLNQPSFKPFCIDTKMVEAAMDEAEKTGVTIANIKF